MTSRNIIYVDKEYSAGIHRFTTVGDGSTQLSPPDLIGLTPNPVLTLLTSNVGIGTTRPTVSLDIRGTDAVQLPSGTTLDRPSGQDGMIRYNSELQQFEGYSQSTWGSIGSGGGSSNGGIVDLTNITSVNITSSNLTVLGTLTFGPASGILKNRLQVNPLRKMTYVSTASCNEFYLNTEGFFGAEASNVDVYIGLQRLIYYTSNITYYNVETTYSQSHTYFKIQLTEPAVYGDLVDITVYPQMIEASSNYPGYVYQQVNLTYFEKNNNDVYYLGNVGIGTSNTMAKLTVEGSIYPSACNIYDLGSSNYRWRDLYLSGNTIDLGGTRISRDFNTGGMKIQSSTGTSVDLSARNIYATGNLSIGTGYSNYQYYGSNGLGLILPASSGTMNGVNITALNKRTRASYAAARDCVNNFTLRYSSSTITSLRQICWASELSLFVAVTDNNILTSPDGITWILQTSPGSNRFWNSICWSPQLLLFVAIEYSSYFTTGDNIITSSNGIDWTLQTWSGSTTIRWSSICWSPELMLFVVVGDDIRTSPNGINWTIINNPVSDILWQSICWSAELAIFAAIGFMTGYGGVTMISKDGIIWSTYTTISSPSNYICWSPELSLFVAVSANSNSIMTSPDGFTWTTRITPSNYGLKSICWSPELQIFIGCASSDYSDSIFSQDGIHWTLTNDINNTFGYILNSICWSPELSMFVTVGSLDGTSTNILTSGIGMPNAKSVLKVLPSQMSVLSDGSVKIGTGYINNINRLILPSATGNINGVNITSLNKRTHTSYSSALACVSNWTSRTSTADNNWTSICWSSRLSLFVAVASTGNGIMTSIDGITWILRTPRADNAWTSVCFSTDSQYTVFVAVASSGTGNRIMMSTDGIDWSYAVVSPADNNWTSVCWSPELQIFVAVANSGTGDRVMTGDNLGVTWTLQTSAVDNNWVSVCWSSELSLFVAVSNTGTNNRIMTSPDGITWTIRTTPTVGSCSSICWSPELSLFVVVASNGIYRLMTSPDGITWTRYSIGTTYALYSVCWCPELSIFVATSSNRILYSIDGITWNNSAVAANNVWSSVCWSAELSTFVAVSNTGSGNRVMTSAIGMPNSKSVVKAMPSQLYVNPLGNVGIGTNVPTSKLDVRGTIVCSNIQVTGDFVTLNTITSNTEQMVIENAGTGPALKVTQTGENSVAEFYDKESGVALFVGNNGNVGVGTSVPVGKFHIAGSLSNVVVDSKGYLGVGTTNPIHPFHMVTNNSNIIIDRNGNVGIGTNIPINNLHVNGNVNISGILLYRSPVFLATVPIMTFTAYVNTRLTLNTPVIDNINGKVGNTYRPTIPGVYLVYGFLMFDKLSSTIELAIEFNGVTSLTNISSGQGLFNPSATIVGVFYFNGTTDNTSIRVITSVNGSMYAGQMSVAYLSS